MPDQDNVGISGDNNMTYVGQRSDDRYEATLNSHNASRIAGKVK